MVSMTPRQFQRMFGEAPPVRQKKISILPLKPRFFVSELRLIIPLIPPSVNHYRGVEFRNGVPHYYLTKEAEVFRDAVVLAARWNGIRAKYYEIFYAVFLGKRDRLDADNAAKVLWDSLQKAGVIQSDAAVVIGHAYKFRDAENPRTEIVVRGAAKPKTNIGNFLWFASSDRAA